MRKFPDDQGFHCFPTVPDFAEILGNRQMSIPDLRYSSVTDVIFICRVEGGGGGGLGNWSEAIKRIGNELKLSPTYPTVQI